MLVAVFGVTAFAAACSARSVSVAVPNPSGPVAERCAPLSDKLPLRLESLKPRVISPRSPLVHAWGHPAVVVSCGVPVPTGYAPNSAETTIVQGVRWFQQPGTDAVTWTALRPGVTSGTTINVRLVVPNHYKDQGAFLADLAIPLKQALP